VIEARAQEGSKLVGGKLEEIGLPDGFLVGAVVRDNNVIIPTASTRIKAGDSVIAMVTYKSLRKAEAFLAGDKRDQG
jgi:trk system potassium uptake protein